MNSATDPFFPKPNFVLSDAGKVLLQMTAGNDMPPIRARAGMMDIGPFFYTPCQWQSFTLCFPVQYRIKMHAAWWKLELWLQATHQNVPCN